MNFLESVLLRRSILGCMLVLAVCRLCVGQQATSTPSSTRNPSTGFPTVTPIPTILPTLPQAPTISPAPTGMPTISPTSSPTTTASPTATFAPTDKPTTGPTLFPSPLPTVSPTDFPTTTLQPSFSPTLSPAPTLTPTTSPGPTLNPTLVPTISPMPSPAPSIAPTGEPTFANQQNASGKFIQSFDIDPPLPLNASQEVNFESVMKSYTKNITPRDDPTDGRIATLSEVLGSVAVETRRVLKIKEDVGVFAALRRMLRVTQDRALQEFLVVVEYEMTYMSNHSNVSSMPADFRDFVNSNLELVTQDLRARDINVQESFRARTVVSETTPAPTPSPTELPTASPTLSPTFFPTFVPTLSPTDTPSIPPTALPTPRPTWFPTITPESDGGGVNSTTVIAVVVALSVSAILVALFIYYRRRKRQKEIAFQAMRAGGGSRRYGSSQASEANPQPLSTASATQQSTVLASNKTGQGTPADTYLSQVPGAYLDQAAPHRGNLPNGTSYDSVAVVGMISPTDSLVSQKSLLSVGDYNGGESGDEADGTHHLADEFDEYKDKNLEKMRTSVEGNLSNFDGMMSQALTKALMDDDDAPNPKELLWGGQGDSMEIEASALWEVNDWLKRKENATLEERRAFMQETLNKMVASVRHGVIAPEHASRAIHECAALLGLQLAEDFPEDTLIVTGMRKTVRRENVLQAFREFGEISDAAVSANNRGFGLVRFKSPKSINRAMERLRTGEIVVQDVAVMCRVLRPEGNNGRSLNPSWRPPSFPAKTDIERQHSGPPTVVDVDRQIASQTSLLRPASAPVTRHVSRDVSETTEPYMGENGQ